MPELPEVEVFVRRLQPTVGSMIVRAEVLDTDLNLDSSKLDGALISSVTRRGKYIVIGLSDRGDLVIHLRMSGRLRMTQSENEIPYTRLILPLTTGERIFFINPRRLGTAVHSPNGFDAQLGIEPLGSAFTLACFAQLAARSRSPIKPFLLDQQKIAGIGNIYASEVLWRSRLSPERGASTLRQDEVARLHKTIISVLNEAIDAQGTSIGTSVSDYHPSVGEQGEFQNHLSVYGREAEPCERCGHAITRLKQSGRSTYYCTECQI